LNSNATRHTARPHLKACIGIGTLDSSRNGVIPYIHDSIPPDEHSVEKRNVLDERVKHQPIDQKDNERDKDESDTQANKQLIGRISVFQG
jgi:hypothetical protein